MNDNQDYLFLEPLLLQHIGDQLGNAVKVVAAADLTAMGNRGTAEPTVFICYLGDRTKTDAAHQSGSRRIQTLSQHWVTVLAMPMVSSTIDDASLHHEAGPLLGRLLDALTGWKPEQVAAPLQRSGRKASPWHHDDTCFYPLHWKVQLVYPRLKTWQPTP